MDQQTLDYIREHNMILDPKGTRKTKIPLSAFYYTPEMVEKIRSIGQAYLRLAEHITQEYPTFADELLFDGNSDALIRNTANCRRNIVLARCDLFLTDSINLVEINTESPGGSEDMDTLEMLFAKHMPLAEGAAHPITRLEHVLQAIVASYEEQAEQKGIPHEIKPRLALMEWQRDLEQMPERYAIFAQFAWEKGFECHLVSPEQITFSPDGYALTQGKKIDVIYRRVTTSTFQDFPPGYDFIQKLAASRTAVVNPFRSFAADSKTRDALLWSDRALALFPPELKPLIYTVRNHLPRTTLLDNVAEETIDDLVHRKERLVLKQVHAWASQGVYIGSEIPPKEWEDLCHSLNPREWIVQEKITLPTRMVSFFDPRTNIHYQEAMVSDTSPYFFNGEFSGFEVRASQDPYTSSRSRTGSFFTMLPTYKI